MTYHIIRTLWKLMSLLPMGVLHLLSDLLYFPLYYVARYRRKVVRKNLVNAFPEKTEKEIEEIEKKFYASFCDYVMETVKLMSMSPENIKKHIRFEGIEEVERLASQESRPCVIYMGHTFNWEFVTSLPLHFKDPKIQLGQIYHPLANKAMDRLFLELRNQYGSESISMANTLRRILQLQKDKHLLSSASSPTKCPIGKPSIIGWNSSTKRPPCLPVLKRLPAEQEVQFSICHYAKRNADATWPLSTKYQTWLRRQKTMN